MPVKLAPPIIAFIMLVILWESAVRLMALPVFLLPAPSVVAEAAWESRSELVNAFLLTCAAAAAGLAASIIFGTAIALCFSELSLVRRAFFPYAIFLQTVPIVAIAPIIVIWMGSGFMSIAVIAFIVSIFPMITSGTAGLSAADDDLLDLFRLHNASVWMIFWKLKLPTAVPFLLSGIRISGGLAVIGAIIGEFFAGYGSERHGLGYLVLTRSSQLKTADLFATILFSTLLGLLFFTVAGLIEVRATRWKAR